MININDLTIAYNSKIIIDHISFEVKDASCVVLFGPSGSGKTSILNAIANLIPYSGEIKTDKPSYSFQSPKLFKRLTVLDNLSLVSGNLEKIEDYLVKFKMLEFKNQRADKLSGGQMARVNIIRSLLKNDVLLLDEPFSSLDLALKDDVMRILRDEIVSKKGTILVTHDLEEALSLGDRMFCLINGKIEEQDLNSKLLNEDIIKKLIK